MGKKINNSPVGSLDLNRYLGNWYEIARMDHVFERDISHAEAQYTLMENGSIMVINSGIKDNKYRTSQGKAKTTGTPGLLRVSFFGPFYSDYRVLMVDPDYQYALVGSKSAKYLWILSRKPQLEGNVLHSILDEARNRGYDIDDLLWIDQE